MLNPTANGERSDDIQARVPKKKKKKKKKKKTFSDGFTTSASW